MTINKWCAFGLGVVAGAAVVAVVRTPAFRKACAAVVGKGMQLKNDAAAFAESVKEDAEDVIAEAKYNQAKVAKAQKK
ncbi:MAG: hypothetical protein K6E51_00100 [Treponema sp.]|nr:hypothetical protein [Treponema sp.]